MEQTMDPGLLTLSDGRQARFRRIQPADGPALKRFFEQLSEASHDLFYPHPVTDQAIAQRLARCAAGEDRIYVALSGQVIIAYFFLWEIHRPVPILGLGIADEWQGGGLGQQLMSLLIEEAQRLGREGIELTTRLENERAFHVYQKIGFQYQGDVPSHDRHGTPICERRLFLPLKARG
jgi:RimJ/RimL family protein N-acetyltransferase